MTFSCMLFNAFSLPQTIELLLRIVVAFLCGCAIGLQRSHQYKDAGVRTHCIITCAAAALMIVSKYGFADLITSTGSYVLGTDGADSSRLASQIIASIGFLGSGIIIKSGNTIKGLTSAAAIWASTAIGMMLGSGMYIFGIFLTGVVLFILICPRFLKLRHEIFVDTKIFIKVKKPCDNIESITAALEGEKLIVIETKTADIGDCLRIELTARCAAGIPPHEQLRIMNAIPEIYAISS